MYLQVQGLGYGHLWGPLFCPAECGRETAERRKPIQGALMAHPHWGHLGDSADPTSELSHSKGQLISPSLAEGYS